MSFVKPVEYEDASDEVREIYDELIALRGTGEVSHFWKVLAFPFLNICRANHCTPFWPERQIPNPTSPT